MSTLSTTTPNLLVLVSSSLARHRRPVALLPIVAAATCLLVLLVVPQQFSASIALVPESRPTSSTGQLAGLAALAGVSISSGSSVSPQFYAEVLRGRAIRYAVLQRRFPASTFGLDGGADSIELVDAMEVAAATPARRLWLASERLARVTKVTADVRTSIVQLTVTLPWQRAVAAVATSYAEELARFNRVSRQSQARERRQFVEERVREASAQLTDAEDAVRRFLQANRQYQNSPSLMFEYQRLQRALSVQQDLYLELRRQLDAARIAEVDDLPALTTVESALTPERRSSPRRLVWLVSAFVIALLATGATLVLADHHNVLLPGVAESLQPLTSPLRALFRSVRSRSLDV